MLDRERSATFSVELSETHFLDAVTDLFGSLEQFHGLNVSHYSGLLLSNIASNRTPSDPEHFGNTYLSHSIGSKPSRIHTLPLHMQQSQDHHGSREAIFLLICIAFGAYNHFMVVKSNFLSVICRNAPAAGGSRHFP